MPNPIPSVEAVTMATLPDSFPAGGSVAAGQGVEELNSLGLVAVLAVRTLRLFCSILLMIELDIMLSTVSALFTLIY